VFGQLSGRAWSIVLASGTLSPLDSFAGELRLPFHVRLEAPHVVDMRRQVWAGVLPSGPDGRVLTGTFKEVDTVGRP
jgi:Fanconi anemia group J protein